MKKRSPRTNRGQQSRLNLWKMLLKIKLKYKLDWLTSTQKASTFERMRTLQTETWKLRKSYPSETVPRNGRDPSCSLIKYKALLGMSMNNLEELLCWFCLGQCSRFVLVISSMDHKFWVWKKQSPWLWTLKALFISMKVICVMQIMSGILSSMHLHQRVSKYRYSAIGRHLTTTQGLGTRKLIAHLCHVLNKMNQQIWLLNQKFVLHQGHQALYWFFSRQTFHLTRIIQMLKLL